MGVAHPGLGTVCSPALGLLHDEEDPFVFSGWTAHSWSTANSRQKFRHPLQSAVIRTAATLAQHSSRVKTYEKFIASSAHVLAWPLRPILIEDFTVHLKSLKYRSIGNFISAIKRKHVEKHYAVDENLDLVISDCRRAGRRRLGPPRRAKSFTWCKLGKLSSRRIPATPILLPLHVAAAGSQVMLRGAEVGAINLEDVAIVLPRDDNPGAVDWHISHLKVDAAARGCRLRLHCTCRSPMAVQAFLLQCQNDTLTFNATLCCPFCTVLFYAYKVHGSLGPWTSKDPFFATHNGDRISAHLLAHTLDTLNKFHTIEDLDEAPPAPHAGALPPSWGGHSLRRSGAREWTRAGLAESALRTLGRWSSDAIMCYLAGMTRNIFLNSVTQTTSHCTVQLMLSHSSLHDKVDEALSAISELRSSVSAISHATTAMPSAPAGAIATTPAHMVVILSMPRRQERRSRLHLSPPLKGPIDSWQASGCSYKFGRSKFSVFGLEDLQLLTCARCTRCFAPPHWIQDVS